MDDKDRLISLICAMMDFGAFYSIKSLKDKYRGMYGDQDLYFKISRVLLSESKKANPRVIRTRIQKIPVYTLNDEYDFKHELDDIVNNNTIQFVQSFVNDIQLQNIKQLNKWLETKFMNVLVSVVSDELKTEVVPLIDNHIINQLKISKDHIKNLMLEIMRDVVNELSNESGDFDI